MSISVPGSVLLVCLGNICRSPIAEVVLRTHAEEAGLGLTVASAGTGGWHVGKGADERMCAHGRARGYQLSGHRAQQLSLSHFYEMDLILAMDASNLADIRDMAPPNREAQIGPFLRDGSEVPDPYYGGPHGFLQVIDMVEAASAEWVAEWGGVRG